MSAVHERFVTDRDGKRTAVLLDMDEYAKLLQELEELESLKAYDAANQPMMKPFRSNKPSPKSKRIGSVLLRRYLAARSERTRRAAVGHVQPCV